MKAGMIDSAKEVRDAPFREASWGNARMGTNSGRNERVAMFCEKPAGEDVATDAELADENSDGPGRGLYVVVKPTVEWIAALCMGMFLAPLIAVLAALVKLSSPGPAFYSQVRLGRSGRPYDIYKLRTMAHNCEAQTGAVWSSGQGDPRVTRLGRFLRDTHLDELPQLWNVLRGEMSLIGPRPERPEIATKLERVVPGYSGRLGVKPGVTGLAQVQLPADTDTESVRRKLAYDLHYIQEVSFVLDAKIFISTSFQILASSINAVGRSLVNAERATVERATAGDLKIVQDRWRIGAA